jgi:hypothetical protein
MKLNVRPLFWNVDILGVEMVGKGTDPTAASDVRVMVEGVCTLVANVGEGGKTKSVCEGVWAISTDLLEALEAVEEADGRRRTLCLRCRGGGAGFDDSARLRMLRGRMGGRDIANGLGGGAVSGSESCSMTIGLDGTAGSTEIDIDDGRRFLTTGGTGGRSNELRTAVAGGGGSAVKLVRHAGAEGGGANRAV